MGVLDCNTNVKGKDCKNGYGNVLVGRGVYRKPWVSWVTGHFLRTLKDRHSFGLRAPSDFASSACAGTAWRHDSLKWPCFQDSALDGSA